MASSLRHHSTPFWGWVISHSSGYAITALLSYLRSLSSTSHVSQTPNPVLGIDEVNPSPVPRPGPFSSTRVTLHYIKTNVFRIHHNYDLRLPDNQDDFCNNFPPSLILDLIYAASFVAFWGNQDSIGHILDKVCFHYYDHDMDEDEEGSGGEDKDGGGSGKGKGRSGDDSGAETKKDEGVHHNKSKGRSTKHEGTDPLLLKDKARGNALDNALDFLLLFQKYCVQGAGPMEERLEKEEQMKRRTESIEKVKGWEARSDSTI